MARHPRDVVSLILGLLLVATAGLFLLADLTEARIDPRWTGPIALIGIGVTGLLASTRRRDRP